MDLDTALITMLLTSLVAVPIGWSIGRAQAAQSPKEEASVDVRRKAVLLDAAIADLEKALAQLVEEGDKVVRSVNYENFRAVYLQHFHRAAERSNEMLMDTVQLLASWRDAIEVRAAPFDAVRVIYEEVRAAQRGAKAANHKVKIGVATPGPIWVIGDEKQFARCIRAMLTQAVAQTTGGKIDVVAKRREGVLSNRELMTIQVRDAAGGINAAQCAMLFKPEVLLGKLKTRSAKRRIMRLNVAERLAKAMNGALEVKKTPKGEVEFVMTLDFRPPTKAMILMAQQRRREKSSEVEAPRPSSAACALVVDPEPDRALEAVRLLERFGLEKCYAIKNRAEFILGDRILPTQIVIYKETGVPQEDALALGTLTSKWALRGARVFIAHEPGSSTIAELSKSNIVSGTMELPLTLMEVRRALTTAGIGLIDPNVDEDAPEVAEEAA